MSRGISRITSIVPTIEGREHLLLRSIGSLITQELPEGVGHEILISFDSLNQEKARLLAEAMEEFKRDTSASIRVIKRTSCLRGVADARNRALQQTSGDAIYFLDDDDIALPRCLAILTEWMVAAQADFVAGDYRITEEDESGDALSSAQCNISSTWLVYEQILVKNMIPMGSFLIRKDLIRRPFNPALRTHEDWLFLLDNINAGVASLCEGLTVDIRRTTDRAGSHRNPAQSDPQVLRDHLIIYGLHPSTEMREARAEWLQQLEKLSKRIACTSLLLADNSNQEQLPAIIEREGAKYLILNKRETIQESIFNNGSFEKHLAALTCNLIEQIGMEGDIVDVGANQGTYSIAVA
jgi:glycosyltransferase involved in cell wall biosynthesis